MTEKEKAKEAHRLYVRLWNRENKDKVKRYNQKYWENRVRKKLKSPVSDLELAELVKLEKSNYYKDYARKSSDKCWAKKYDELVEKSKEILE